jgi:BRCA1 C Terminus (BRCT) domain
MVRLCPDEITLEHRRRHRSCWLPRWQTISYRWRLRLLRATPQILGGVELNPQHGRGELGFFGRLFGLGQSPAGIRPQGMKAHLRGPGTFGLPIVGESHYQEALEPICGPRSEEGEDRRVEARLVLENDNPHDSMAIRVDIQARTVGYLSREHARQYRKQLERAGHSSTDAYCDARIRGGWDRGEGGQGHYGVLLDLPMDGLESTRPSHATASLDHGQPPKALYGPRVSKRLVSELLGLCKGIICDGQTSERELSALKRWLAGHPDAAVLYPGKTVAERLLRIYGDGIITPEERQELNELLLDLTGETDDHAQPLNLTTRLPFDEPIPTILFDGHEHVFTGRMLYSTRRDCERKVVERGGRVGKTVTQRTNFLVIGPIASSAWLESTHGRSSTARRILRSQGLPLRIVSEEAWIQVIDQTK